MKVLVTGAEGFVGRWMVDALRAEGWDVVGTYRPVGQGAVGSGPPAMPAPHQGPGHWVPLELLDAGSVEEVVAGAAPDAVIHLAAVSSVRQAAGDLEAAWQVNHLGTVHLLGALARHAARRDAEGADPVTLLVVSTAEVYGAGAAADVAPGGPARRREEEPPAPVSVYAASKAAAELSALEAGRRIPGLRVVVARPFPHTGPGQDEGFVTPAFARRLRGAARENRREIPTGNLSPIRELLDVRDVVRAYLMLVERGEADTVYNVARGEGYPLAEIFRRLAERLHPTARPVEDPALTRPVDIATLVGDGTRLAALGWVPRHTLSETLQDVIDAQAD